MSQIKKKFIADKAIDGSKILLQNNEALKALNASGVEQSLLKFNSSGALELMQLPEVSSDPTSSNQIVRKSYMESQISAEQSRAEGEEARIEAKLDQQISDSSSAVSAEESRAMAAESALDGRLDTLEGADNVAGSVAKALKDAKSYADQKITDLVNGAPGVLDTLKELSDALGGDENFAATLAGQMAGLDGRLDTLEGDDTTSGSVAKALKDAKSYTDSEVSAEETRAMGEESRIEAKLDQEILDRQAGDSQTLSDAQAYAEQKKSEGMDYTDAQVLTEKNRAEGEEARIEGKVDQEILDRASAVSAEQSRAESAESALSGRLDVIEGSDTTEGSVAKAEKDAKDYADQKISDLVNSAPAVLDTLKELSDALGGDENFSATVAGQIGSLDSRLDTLEGADTVTGSVAKALKDAKAYTDSEVSSEESRAMGEESRIEGKVDQEVSDRQAAISSEQTARENADNALDARLDIIEGADTQAGSVAKALKDAKAYTDAQIAIEQDVRDAEVTALSDRLDIVEGDATTEGSVAKAEQDAKDYADSLNSAMDSRVDALEAVQHRKETFTLSSGDISNGYIELSMEAASNSTVVFVGRLGAVEGIDYSVSVVSSKTRITWTGELASGGASELVASDKVHVKFMK